MRRIVKIVVLSIIAAVLVALMIWGIAARSMIYFSGGRLMFGEQASWSEGAAQSDFETDALGIKNIQLDFVSESIDVVATDGDTIRIEERSSSPLKEEQLMRVSTNGDTLSAVSGMKNDWGGLFHFMDIADVQVTLYVPSGYHGNLDLYSTSGRIGLEDVQGDMLKLNSTSGAITVTGANANKLEIGSTSGAVMADGGEYDSVDANTVSGAIKLNAERMDSIDAGSTSGAVNIEAGNMPEMIDAGTVSGSVTLRLPENDGFILDYNSVSGGLNCDFALAHDIYKDGGSSISVDTVSGAINILKK